MKRILISSLSIIAALGIIAGGTGAFFSDAETASGNTFAAGVIDLKIDNESYYNGEVSTSTTWLVPSDLGDGLLFFNFTDLKPDDEGEDTISIHVDTNPAWACMDISLTSDDDRSSNEPELATGDAPEDGSNSWDGELAEHIQFAWWADDGDNVYEAGENIISDGPDGVLTLDQLLHHGSSSWSVALADSADNIWSSNPDDPIDPNTTQYIGKAWCFGTLTPNALAQDNAQNDGPIDDADIAGADRIGTGFDCDGAGLGNETQTDGVTIDVAFRAIQARDQEDFLCEDGSRMAKLTVIKNVINDNGGNNVVSDFQLFIVNSVNIPVTSGATTTLSPGEYRVSEESVNGYTGSYGGDCDADGDITLSAGDEKTCIVTNDDLPASIILSKSVTNDNGGTAGPQNFVLRINGSVAPQNSQVQVTSNTPHTISEDARAGYTFTGMTTVFSFPGSISCPAVLGGTVTLPEGALIFCQINNNDNS